jgi:hypothetical protein
MPFLRRIIKKNSNRLTFLRQLFSLSSITPFFKKTWLKILSAFLVFLTVIIIIAINKLNLKNFFKTVHAPEIQDQNPQPQATPVQTLGEQDKKIDEPPQVPVYALTDTLNWLTYKEPWYGFELKYPELWPKPTIKKAAANDLWYARYQFRAPQNSTTTPSDWGFDIIIYNLSKTTGLEKTAEFPKEKYPATTTPCVTREPYLVESFNFPAEEFLTKGDNECFEPAFFYTIIKDQYLYNIVPVNDKLNPKEISDKQTILNQFPEFFNIAAHFDLIPIQRPKPVPPKPKITAPMPLDYKKVGGRLVCRKGSSDKPSKSNKGKGKHLDMECCLDPDEYPNPHCYYPPEKYGKYLK